MTLHVSVMTLAVKDLNRAKEFYRQGHSSPLIGHILPWRFVMVVTRQRPRG